MKLLSPKHQSQCPHTGDDSYGVVADNEILTYVGIRPAEDEPLSEDMMTLTMQCEGGFRAG